MADVFISYSGKEGGQIADAINKGLQEKAPQSGLPQGSVQVFIAHQMESGKVWANEIWEKLGACKRFIFVVTRESIVSSYALQELGAAMMGAIQKKKKIIPLLGGGMTSNDLPGFLKGLHVRNDGLILEIDRIIDAIVQEKLAILEREKREKKAREDALMGNIFMPIKNTKFDEERLEYLQRIFGNPPKR